MKTATTILCAVLTGAGLLPVWAGPAPTPAPAAVPGFAPPPVVAVPAAVPPVALGAGDEGEDVSGRMRLKDMAMPQLLELYGLFTGRSILRPANLPTVNFSFTPQNRMTRGEAVEAIETMLALNEITVIPMGEKFAKAVPSANAPSEPPQFYPDGIKELPEAARYTMVALQLKHVKPTEVLDALTPFSKLKKDAVLAIDGSRTLILRDYAQNVKRMSEIIEKIDVPVPTEEKFEIIPIKYAMAADIATVLSTLTTTPQTFTSAASQRLATGGGLGGGGAGGFGGGAGGLGGGGAGGLGGGGSTGGFGGGTRGGAGGTGIRSSAGQAGGGAVQAPGGGGGGGGTPGGGGARPAPGASATARPILGDTRIIPYERNNAVLVMAENQVKLDIVKELLASLDKVQQQVLIEAIIMDVALDDNLNYGVTIGQDKQNVTGSLGSALGMKHGGNFYSPKTGANGAANPGASLATLGSGLNYWGFVNNKWEVAIEAIKSDTRVNVLSRPRIQTSHAELATLFIGETHPYVSGTSQDVNGGLRSQYESRQIGIRLSVLPFINPDGLVVMDIEQSIGDIVSNKVIDNVEVPVTTDRSANAKIAVRDGDTVMLGGFIKTRKVESSSGVPILKDLPLLGVLFRENKDNNERQELVVMMRPTVLETPESSAHETISSRNGMPALRQAELDERSMEIKLRKQLQEKERKLGKEGAQFGGSTDPRLLRGVDQFQPNNR